MKCKTHPLYKALAEMFDRKPNPPPPTQTINQPKQLQIEVQSKPGGVRILFNQETQGIAFTPQQAIDLAQILINEAAKANADKVDPPRILTLQ